MRIGSGPGPDEYIHGAKLAGRIKLVVQFPCRSPDEKISRNSVAKRLNEHLVPVALNLKTVRIPYSQRRNGLAKLKNRQMVQ